MLQINQDIMQNLSCPIHRLLRDRQARGGSYGLPEFSDEELAEVCTHVQGTCVRNIHDTALATLNQK